MAADASSIADLAVRVGLLQFDQVQEAWEELESKAGPWEDFVRVMQRKGYLTPFQSQKLVKGDTDGYFLGGYRLLYMIAAGSFGRVFRADDPSSGRIVAIKVLRRKWSQDKHKIDLFLREGKVGMNLHHPNIVEILAVSQDRATSQYYLVMEFVEGGTLKDFLAIRKKLEPIEAIKILEDTTAGLAYAFSQGLTHRDMKLSNVLISSGGTAKLVDFGLAEISDFKASASDKEVEVARSVDYAGLEKATGVPHGDTRSDLFFLGCVGYQLLTGRSPIDMAKEARLRMDPRRFSNIEPMKPDEIVAPGSVFRLIENMMSLEPNHRYQTPSQLLDAVRKTRHELEGKGQKSTEPKAVFIAERDESLQNALREKLKEKGFRVFIAGDPQRALDRFRQQPFDVLVVDAGTTGEEGLLIFGRIMADAARQKLTLGGILLLNADQSEWAKKVEPRSKQTILVQPIKFKQLLNAIRSMSG